MELEQRQDESTRPSRRVLELRKTLARLQRQRQDVQHHQWQQEKVKTRLQNHVHELQHENDLAQQDFKAWKLQHKHTRKILDQESVHWNVLNDAFSIGHQGPFGTINGCRLGADAAILPLASTSNATAPVADEPASTSMTSTALGMMASTVMLPGRMLGFGGGQPAAQESNSSNANNTSSTAASNQEQSSSASNNNGSTNPPNNSSITPSPSSPLPAVSSNFATKVPWTEINSALGQVALLLSVLEQSCPNISFPHHVIVPMGSTSKIGIRQANAITGYHHGATPPVVAMYPLFSDDATGMFVVRPLFGKRNFNLGLRALTECLQQAALAIQQRDRTIVMPFDIHYGANEPGHPSAPCTIGGLPVHYGTNGLQDGLQWTRVMKYLLTNVKWCVAYMVKHVDR